MQHLRFILCLLCFCGLAWVRAEDLTPAQSTAAKKVYTSKCSRCHKFYEPTQYEDQDWSSWMIKMRKKAKLNASDYDLLTRYLEQLRMEAKTANSRRVP